MTLVCKLKKEQFAAACSSLCIGLSPEAGEMLFDYFSEVYGSEPIDFAELVSQYKRYDAKQLFELSLDSKEPHSYKKFMVAINMDRNIYIAKKIDIEGVK